MLLFALSSNVPAAIISLDQLEWQNRLILVKSAQPEKLQVLFTKHRDAIDERHVIWFILQDNNMLSNYTGKIDASVQVEVRRFLMGATDDNMLLIGKDGQVKSRDNGVDLFSVFEQIDAMPMRQIEMQNE